MPQWSRLTNSSLLWLVLLTCALVAGLRLLGLPAAFLLGAMLAAMMLAGAGKTAQLRLPERLFACAQAVVGCLIARNFTIALFHTILTRIWLFAGLMLAVLLVATLVGLVLARTRLLPGSTALWGVFPGAATVMVLLSGSFGGDMRLVAVMQYLRVVVVAATASIVARMVGLSGNVSQHTPLFEHLDSPSFFMLLALVVAAGFIVPRFRIPAGALLIPMLLATVLQDVGLLRIELPQALLIASYIVVGWAIGLRFTRESFADAAHSLPQIIGAIVLLVAACAGIGWALARIAHIDLLTAYLATSPGGADSIAIIAAGTPIDLPLVMAAQMARFLAVLLLGPPLAKRAALLTPALPPASASGNE